MAWRVDEVDEVLEAVADVEERDGAALHGDATLLVKKFVDTNFNIPSRRNLLVYEPYDVDKNINKNIFSLSLLFPF